MSTSVHGFRDIWIECLQQPDDAHISQASGRRGARCQKVGVQLIRDRLQGAS